MQSIEKRHLAFQNTLSALGDGKPTSTIHLGNFDHTAGVRRPFHLAVIADHCGGVAIALKGPNGDNLTTRLPHSTEFDKSSLGSKARLLLKFALCSFKGNFAVHVLSLRNGPRAHVFLSPERATRVHQENLQLVIVPAIHQQSCTHFCHDSSMLPSRCLC